MTAFLDAWRAGTALPEDELVPLMRAFTLACVADAARRHGLTEDEVSRLLRSGQLTAEQVGRYKQSNYNRVGGLMPVYKQFMDRSVVIDRIMLGTEPVGHNDWMVVIRVNTVPNGEGYHIQAVYVGMLRYGARPTGLESRLVAAAERAWSGNGYTLTQLPKEETHEYMWGTGWSAGQWGGTEADLVQTAGQLLAALLPVLVQRREWRPLAAPMRFAPRFETLGKVEEAAGRDPETGSYQFGFRKREGRYLAGRQWLEGAVQGEPVRFRISSSKSGEVSITSCEGAYDSIRAVGQSLGLRHGDRAWFTRQPDGTYNVEPADPPGLLLTGVDPTNIEEALGARGREYRNAVERGASVPVYTNGSGVISEIGWLHGVGGRLGVIFAGQEEQIPLEALVEERTGRPLAGRLDPGIAFVYLAADPAENLPDPDPVVPDLRIHNLSEILEAFAADPDLVYDRTDLINLHLALTALPHKHFVILHGVSGTGKSQFAQGYANALYGRSLTESGNPYYRLVAVQPTWQDRTALLGYYNPLTERYEVPDFLAHVLKAEADPDHLYIICLDEMNLAVVEHYFADFLSAWESREAVVLHHPPNQENTVPERLRIPANLAVIGTVNVDETTHGFSPKVLDRAYTVELTHVDAAGYAAKLYARPEAQPYLPMLEQSMALLEGVHRELAPHGLHFAYRTLEEIVQFLLANARSSEPLPEMIALDLMLAQKVLPRLRGDDRLLGMLETLEQMTAEFLGAHPGGGQYRTPASLARMAQDARRYGTFQYWR